MQGFFLSWHEVFSRREGEAVNWKQTGLGNGSLEEPHNSFNIKLFWRLFPGTVWTTQLKRGSVGTSLQITRKNAVIGVSVKALCKKLFINPVKWYHTVVALCGNAIDV